MSKKELIGVYPGSFDPITLAHIDVVCRFSKLYNKVIVLVASSIHKKYWFDLNERYDMAREAFKGREKIEVEKYEGLTTDYLKEKNLFTVLRGVRSVTDFPYERDLAINNKKILPQMETLFLFSTTGTEAVSAKWIKEIAYHKGNLKGLVPDFVEEKIKKHLEGVEK